MDGLEDAAAEAAAKILFSLQTKEVVEIGRSSRASTMIPLCEQLRSEITVSKVLVLRGGISVSHLTALQEALEANQSVESLRFVGLKSLEEVDGVLECCRRQPRIKTLTLENYGAVPATRRSAQDGDLAQHICQGIFGTIGLESAQGDSWKNTQPRHPRIPNLTTLDIDGYPIGTKGMGIFANFLSGNQTLSTLRLKDCSLRSDASLLLANMIKNNSCIQELDLSYNRHFLSPGMTREMTFKTIVQRGLRFNTSLLKIKMEYAVNDPVEARTIQQQLDINRFRKGYKENTVDLFTIHHAVLGIVLTRVAPKPSTLYEFLREGAPLLFPCQGASIASAQET